ncbi:MAG: phytanoyl-CoA dioxygenase family protein [Candidatus Latescibacteria bacterium]|nr:phytanoyl-CoA dioxygenase family protein [Candidatus Latescibacterota bacterium]
MHPKAPYNETYDCPPTLTDQQMIDFCRNGFMIFPGVVPDEINRQVVDYLDKVDSTYEPTPMMTHDWFVEGVLKNPQAAGAVRSLLGRNFTLPVIISNHRGQLPSPHSGGWHRDGGSIYTPALEYLQVFYLPEECTDDMGPTEVLPGSHFMRIKANMMAHYGKITGTVSTASPAGTIFLTIYSIWHRRTRATSGSRGKSTFRNLLKYNYWRTTPPQRDWIIDPNIDFNRINFNPSTPGAFEQFQGGIATARMFCWLCGIEDQYVKRGGQCWPIALTVRDGVNQMGTPLALQNSE